MADTDLVVWGPDRSVDLAALWQQCADELISEEELASALWGPRDVVLGTEDGQEAVAVRIRTESDGTVLGWIRLVAVHPERQRQGRGAALIGAAENWLRRGAAVFVGLADEAPPYLWPGVDVTNIAAQALAVSCGYEPVESTLNMSLPVSFRVEPPEGVAIRRLLDDGDVVAVRAMVEHNWDVFLPEFDLAVDSATLFGAFTDTGPVGFAAHSVARIGWLGPMGTAANWGGRGIGSTLVSAVCTDLMVAGRSSVEVCRVGPVHFYATLGAEISRRFQTYLKAL